MTAPERAGTRRPAPTALLRRRVTYRATVLAFHANWRVVRLLPARAAYAIFEDRKSVV